MSRDDVRRIEFYSRFIKPGDLVFDVGANMGNRTKAFLKLGARVVAFEPQKRCADYLETVLNKERNFRLVRKALGPDEGKGELLICGQHVLASMSPRWVEATRSSGRFGQFEWDKWEVVEMTTLDLAIQAFGIPSFIKIDVEGFESDVLSGLSNQIRCISVEFVAEDLENAFRCVDHLASLGPIECQISFGESLVFQLPSWVSPQQLKTAAADADALTYGDIYIRST